MPRCTGVTVPALHSAADQALRLRKVPNDREVARHPEDDEETRYKRVPTKQRSQIMPGGFRKLRSEERRPRAAERPEKAEKNEEKKIKLPEEISRRDTPTAHVAAAAAPPPWDSRYALVSFAAPDRASPQQLSASRKNSRRLFQFYTASMLYFYFFVSISFPPSFLLGLL